MHRPPAPRRRRAPRPRRAAGPRPPWLRIDLPADAPDPAWTARATIGLIALAAVLLLVLAFRFHVIGDYFTESDFYGGYAEGARQLQHGRIDPGRYRIYGPVYEVVLAATGWIARDLFAAARIVSVASAVATLALLAALLARCARPAAGLWGAAFLAANPVFLRYGFSATTDALAVALQAGSVFALAAGRGAGAPFRAGLLAAAATLTRYSALALVPAALASLAWIARPAGLSRGRALVGYAAGFAALALPWLAFSLSQGQLPGEGLIDQFATFYRNPETSRNLQDAPVAALDSLRGAGAARAAGSLAADLVEHLRLDLMVLVGAPVAVVCAIGAALAPRDRIARALAPAWLAGACLFLALVPVFYSDRYSLAHLPMLLTLAGVAIGSPRLALAPRGAPIPLKWVAALAVLGATVPATTRSLREVLGQMPVEVLETGRVLRSSATAGTRVLSRKGHLGFHAGVPTVAFPRVRTLPELARHCREQRVSHLFISWYEAELRPEFWALLDTSRVVPGLTVVHATEHHPSVLYAVGPGFGSVPDWFANDTLRRVQEARAQVRVLPDDLAWEANLLLGQVAQGRGEPREALARFEAARRGRPGDARTWGAVGDAQVRLGRLDEAQASFQRALALDPANVATRARLGLLLYARGDPARAAEVWRPVVAEVRDRAILARMLEAYERTGDAATAARVRQALAGAAP